jgi:hypothetical protein
MSSGVIKKIERRQHAARQVANLVKGQEEAVAEALTLRLSPLLEAGEAMPDVRLLLRLLAREEQQRILAVSQADEAHDIELSDDAPGLRRRDEATSQGRQLIIATRNLIAVTFGAGYAEQLGLTGGSPRYPRDVLAALVRVASKWKAHEADAPPPIEGALALDLSVFLPRFEAAAQELLQSMDHVDQEDTEAAVTMSRRQAALEDFDDTHRDVAQVINGLTRLSGLSNLKMLSIAPEG